MIFNGFIVVVGTRFADVAQVSNLLYRGFPIRNRHHARTVSRLEVGDTAGWKPALRQRIPIP